MAEDLFSALQTLLGRLKTVAANDPELRSHLRGVARALVALVVEVEPTPYAPPTPFAPPPAPVASTPEPVETVALQLAEATVALVQEPAPVAVTVATVHEPAPAELPAIVVPDRTFRAETITVPFVSTPVHPPLKITDDDLPILANRCRLKTEGARWASTRARLAEGGSDYWSELESPYHDLITRAKDLPDCYLWMVRRNASGVADAARFDEVAGNYEALATAVDLLVSVLQRPDYPDLLARAVVLAAEAQSGLRGALPVEAAVSEHDQHKVFNWLCSTGAARGIWIERYMSLDDPADPAGWKGLIERIRKAEDAVRNLQERERRRRKLFQKIRYHIKRMENVSPDGHTSDWQTVLESITTLVQDGLPPSNKEIRELLLPILDDLPEEAELSKEFSLVHREIDRFLALRPAEVELKPRAAPTEEVRRASHLLRGGAIVLIGGDRRPQAAEALTDALGLSELVWVEGRDQSYIDFEADIARPDVAIVLLAIRWSRHGFSEVKQFCDRYGKPLVRLKGGYSPNQVAYHIISQVGDRLADDAARAG